MGRTSSFRRMPSTAGEDSEEYDAWVDYLANGGTTKEWNDHGKAIWKSQRRHDKKLEKSENGNIIKSDKNDDSSDSLLQYRHFDTVESVNDFFYYDDEKRGLMARKKSLHGN